MAPEETITTRCPSLTSLTTVSIMRERMEMKGSWVFSSTIELVPIEVEDQLLLLDAAIAHAYPI